MTFECHALRNLHQMTGAQVHVYQLMTLMIASSKTAAAFMRLRRPAISHPLVRRISRGVEKDPGDEKAKLERKGRWCLFG